MFTNNWPVGRLRRSAGVWARVECPSCQPVIHSRVRRLTLGAHRALAHWCLRCGSDTVNEVPQNCPCMSQAMGSFLVPGVLALDGRLPCQQRSNLPRCASRRQHACRPVVAQAKGGRDPPDIPKGQPRGGREWLQTLLSRFGPITQKPENTAVLDFEKPLVELDNRITEVCIRSIAIVVHLEEQACETPSRSTDPC